MKIAASVCKQSIAVETEDSSLNLRDQKTKWPNRMLLGSQPEETLFRLAVLSIGSNVHHLDENREEAGASPDALRLGRESLTNLMSVVCHGTRLLSGEWTVVRERKGEQTMKRALDDTRTIYTRRG